jgi:hypothetical protein
MTELPIILDDFVEEELQNQIEDSMFDCFWNYHISNTMFDGFWNYHLNNSVDSKNTEIKYRKFLNPLQYEISPAFIADIKGPQNKKTYEKLISIIERGCNKINFNIEKIERCYGAIHAIIRDNSKQDNIHVNKTIPHLVMLYYVNDSDGDTILYDKVFEDIHIVTYRPNECGNLNIKNRVSPKKGRILFFDGRFYHSSSTPSKSTRCIVTIDLFGEFKDGSHKFSAPMEKPKNNFVYQ